MYQSCGRDVEDRHRKELVTGAAFNWLRACRKGRMKVRRAVIAGVMVVVVGSLVG